MSRRSSRRRKPRCRSRRGRTAWRSSSRAKKTGGAPAGGSRSDRDQLAVLAPGGPEPVADLADRRVGLDRLDQRRQQVLVALRRVLEPAERGRPGPAVTLRSNPSNPLDLAPLPLRVDLLELRRRCARRVVAVLVDAD